MLPLLKWRVFVNSLFFDFIGNKGYVGCRNLVIVVLPALSLVCAGAVFSRVTWLERVGRPGEASSETSEFQEDDEMLSVDDEDVASAAPFPSPVAASGVPVLVSDVPASDVAPALDVPEVPVSVPDVPAEIPSSVVPASHVLPTPVSDVPSSVPVQDVQCYLRFRPLPRFQVLIVIKMIDPLLLSALGELSLDDVVRMSNKEVADFVSRLMCKHSLSPDCLQYMINYVFRVQKFPKKSSDAKKPVKSAPAKLLGSADLPASKPTRPDRVPSK